MYVYEREYETGQVKNCVQEHRNTVEHGIMLKINTF